MISSTSNVKIRLAAALGKRGKARREQDLFVAEGLRMFSELPKDRIHSVFATTSFLKSQEHRKLLSGLPYEEVSEDVMDAMAGTKTPQGILALARQYHYAVEDMLNQPGPAFLMVLERIQDPGNLGTILRAGEGAGVTGVVMDGQTADVYNPKVIRSTMGSICRVPFAYVENLGQALVKLKKRGIKLFAAQLDGRNNYDQEDYTGSIGFLIGNEAGGLSQEASALADAKVRIPMLGKVESLNAAVASSILMFEAARQRR